MSALRLGAVRQKVVWFTAPQRSKFKQILKACMPATENKRMRYCDRKLANACRLVGLITSLVVLLHFQANAQLQGPNDQSLALDSSTFEWFEMCDCPTPRGGNIDAYVATLQKDTNNWRNNPHLLKTAAQKTLRACSSAIQDLRWQDQYADSLSKLARFLCYLDHAYYFSETYCDWVPEDSCSSLHLNLALTTAVCYSTLNSKSEVPHSPSFERAEFFYRKALELDSANYQANYGLGALYYNQGVKVTKLTHHNPDSLNKNADRKDEAETQAIFWFSKAIPYQKKAQEIYVRATVDQPEE